MVFSVWLLMCASAVIAQQAPVPVDQEPYHHVVLKNDSIMVLHVKVPPGEITAYHTHSHDRASVDLDDNRITRQVLGERESPPQENKPGDVSAIALGDAPYTHRVKNVGTKMFDVIDVEFLQRPKEPSSLPAAKVAAENPSARIYQWKLAPGAVSSMHTHKRPYLIIAATTMMLKMTAPDGQSSTHEVKAGDFHWIDSAVTHALANEGSAAGQIVEIRAKVGPRGIARGGADASPALHCSRLLAAKSLQRRSRRHTLVFLTPMPRTLDPDLRRALAERVRYCHEMGIYDFYRREPQASESGVSTLAIADVDDPSITSLDLREEMAPKKSAVVAQSRRRKPSARADLPC